MDNMKSFDELYVYVASLDKTIKEKLLTKLERMNNYEKR